jgi:hypothetical protein
LTAEQARAALEIDWLHQAGQNTAPMQIQGGRVWHLTRPCRSAAHARTHPRRDPLGARVGCADRVAACRPGLLRRRVGNSTNWSSGPPKLTDGDRELYFQVRDVKRGIMFRNPVIDFDKLLFIDKPYPQGREWNHETRHRLGYQAVPGGRLLVLEGLGPAGPDPVDAAAPLHGSFWRPDCRSTGRRSCSATSRTTRRRFICTRSTSTVPGCGN